jgi:hypothetical protein
VAAPLITGRAVSSAVALAHGGHLADVAVITALCPAGTAVPARGAVSLLALT